MSTKVAKHQLKSIVERIERLEEERKNLAADIKEVYAEAKANGFDVKIIRKAVALRKKEPAVREEEDAMLEVYLGALDMLPLFQMADAPKTIAEQLREETHSTAAIEPHAVDSAGAGVAAASSVPASSFVSDDPDAGNLTASRSTPADCSGLHDPETGEVFDDPEQPLTEAPPSPYPSVIEEGGAAPPVPPSEPFDDECETVFEFHAEISAEQAKAQLAAMREGPGEMPDFLRRNKQQAVA